MQVSGDLTYLPLWLGISFLMGLVLLLTRLIVNTETKRQHRIDAALPPDNATTRNFFSGLHGEIPRAEQTRRDLLDTLKTPPIMASLDDLMGMDLIWVKDRSLYSSGLRYQLKVGHDGPLVAVMEWATPDPLYALMIIGDERWVYERRGEYDQMRISIRLREGEGWVKRGSLDITRSILTFDDLADIRWNTPVFTPINTFIDSSSRLLASFDVSEQKGFADNTTWLVIRRETPMALRAPLAGLGFFALTAEP